MSKRHGTASVHPGSIELSLPSHLGYEKVAMNTAACVATMMGFSEDRVDD